MIKKNFPLKEEYTLIESRSIFPNKLQFSTVNNQDLDIKRQLLYFESS